MGVLLDAYDPGASVAADVPERLLKTASTDRIKSAPGQDRGARRAAPRGRVQRLSPPLHSNVIAPNYACLTHNRGAGRDRAVETINPNIPSTLDAAVLSKMAERGQIHGAVVDGPLAMDNAMDVEAARTKGIASLVAGRAKC
jgi:hypothetical protein